MKNVGKVASRNQEFNTRFSRKKILQVVVNNPNPVIFDVGAHHGESVEFFSETFDSPRIFSFEADSNSFQILDSKNYEDNWVYNYAVTDTNGEVFFYRNRISHTNSIFRVNTESVDSIALVEERKSGGFDYQAGLNEEVIVKSITLDKFCRKMRMSNLDLLKIDVQGAEKKVLDGAKQVLGFTKSILVEVCLFDYYENVSSIKLIEESIPNDFQLYSILEISNNPMNGRTDWVELLYTVKR